MHSEFRKDTNRAIAFGSIIAKIDTLINRRYAPPLSPKITNFHGAPENFNFWGERRHKSPIDAGVYRCDLVAERESHGGWSKDRCEQANHLLKTQSL